MHHADDREETNRHDYEPSGRVKRCAIELLLWVAPRNNQQEDEGEDSPSITSAESKPLAQPGEWAPKPLVAKGLLPVQFQTGAPTGGPA